MTLVGARLSVESLDVSYCEGYRGKRVRRFESQLGSLRAQGSSRAEATAVLVADVVAQCEYAYDRTYVVAADGSALFVLRNTGTAWGYDIVPLEAPGIARRVSTTMYGAGIDKAEALERMQAHAGGYA